MSHIKLAVDNELPDELKEQLSRSYLKGHSNYENIMEKLLPLFNEQEVLSVDEMIVGWYRLYDKEILKRNSFGAKLATLVKEELLIRVGRGTYKLADKGKTP